MISATIQSNDVCITVPASTIQRVPEDIRNDASLLPTYLCRAVEIGLMAMAQAGVNLETDLVKTEFADFTAVLARLGKGLEDLLADELTDDDSKLVRQLRTYLDDDGRFGRTVRNLADQLSDPDRETSIPGRIQTLLDETFFAADAPFRRALDIADDSSPLKRFVLDQQRRIREFQEDQVKKHNTLAESIDANFQKIFAHIGYKADIEEAEAKGTRKGGSFEDTVTDVLASTSLSKDIVERVGRETIDGTRCKRGDVLIDVYQDGLEDRRIVVEAKSGNYTLNGKDGALPQLTVAMNYRNADGGILVVTSKYSGKRQRVFDRLGDNRIVVVVDPDDENIGFLPLELAYAVLRDSLLADRPEIDIDGPDLDAAEATVGEIQAALKAVAAMKSNCTEATKNVNNVREAICQMESTIRERLVSLRRQLQFS